MAHAEMLSAMLGMACALYGPWAAQLSEWRFVSGQIRPYHRLLLSHNGSMFGVFEDTSADDFMQQSFRSYLLIPI